MLQICNQHRKSDYNEQNTQAPLIHCKAYNLVAPGTSFIITTTCIQPLGDSKGPYSDLSNNLAYNYGS